MGFAPHRLQAVHCEANPVQRFEQEQISHALCVLRHIYRFACAEPDRQFMLVKEHVAQLRKDLYRTLSKVKIYVERNLGFEAEHHHRALGDMPGVEFYVVSGLFRLKRV